MAGCKHILTTTLVMCLLQCTYSDTEQTGISASGRSKRYIRTLARLTGNFLSMGLNHILQTITDDDVGEQLVDIQTSLKTIDKNFERALRSLKEIKERFAIEEASKIERKLRVLFKRLETIVDALQIVRRNNTAINEEKNLKLKRDITKFEQDAESIPHLLVEYHSIITGQGVSTAGRTRGLLCEYVSYSIRRLASASSQEYNIEETVKDIHVFHENLVRLQVNSFQLRNGTCSDDLKCSAEKRQLQDQLEDQSRRLRECRPRYYDILAKQDNARNVRILDQETKRSVYTLQTSTIVTWAFVDHDKIQTPESQGLRCSKEDKWSLEKAAEGGYYLRYNNHCYLSFDQSFIGFEKTIPLLWTESDRIDRRDFLICIPSQTIEVAIFHLLPTESDRSTTYQLREKRTGKFLNVHREKTSLYVELGERLVLTLLLNDKMSDGWIIKREKKGVKCIGDAYFHFDVPLDSLRCDDLCASLTSSVTCMPTGAYIYLHLEGSPDFQNGMGV